MAICFIGFNNGKELPYNAISIRRTLKNSFLNKEEN